MISLISEIIQLNKQLFLFNKDSGTASLTSILVIYNRLSFLYCIFVVI